LAIAALVGFTAAPLAASAIWSPPVLLVWNASASAPVGLYRVHDGGPIGRGDMVVAWTPEPVRSLAARRRYLPRNVPLVKRVAAAAGDEVCAIGRTVFVNGRPAALRSRRDPSGRLMPWWSGCRALGRGELFLLNPSVPQAFDGRYFGVTSADRLLGTARLLWRR